MMKRHNSGMLLGMLAVRSAFLIPLFSVDAIPADSDGDPTAWRRIEHRAFAAGERLEYDVVIGVLSAGSGTMGIGRTEEVSGRACYRATATLASNAFFDPIYSVRDTLESVIDEEGIFPWRSRSRVAEGKYEADRSVRFDQERGFVFSGETAVEVPAYTQDLLSVFYYVRTVPLRVGMSIPVSVFTDGRNLSFPIRVLSEEDVTVPAGTFACYVLEPGLRWEMHGGAEGRMTVWLSKDERRMPVLMKTNLLFGAVEAQVRLTGFTLKSE